MILPNFLIIGAPKAGTSSLYEYLKQHPQIYMSPAKEPHFFGLENSKIDFRGPGDLDRYSNAVTNIEDYLKLFQGVTDEIAIGEASTSYLSSLKAPERIKHHIPDVKMIVILRNPVDSAYASYLHLVRDGDEKTKDFATALQKEAERIANNWEGIWHYQQRGFYYAQLKRYFDLFDPQQIKVYRYEDYTQNFSEVMKDVFQFLGVNSSFIVDTSWRYNVSAMPKNFWLNSLLIKPNYLKSTVNTILPKNLRKNIANSLNNWNLNQYKKPELPWELRVKLTKAYRQNILQLQDLIQQDLSLWLNLPE